MAFYPDFRNQRDDLPENHNDLPAEERCRLLEERVRLLHIYAQYVWHGEAKIVGNRNALICLRDAIDDALKNGKSETTAMVTDGEGYGIEIELCDKDWESFEWQNKPLPYTAEYARGSR